MLTQSELNQVRANILAAGASIVASKREEILAVITTCLARADEVGFVEGPAWDVVRALEEGVRNAPPGVIVYHHKLHLLQLFDALDACQDELARREAPANPEPRPAEPVPAATEEFEEPTETE